MKRKPKLAILGAPYEMILRTLIHLKGFSRILCPMASLTKTFRLSCQGYRACGPVPSLR